MKKRRIRFCRHATLKFRLLRRHHFPVTEAQVRHTVLNPVRTGVGYKGRRIAEASIDAEHVLRVVYEERGDNIEIVTFYPVRRSH